MEEKELAAGVSLLNCLALLLWMHLQSRQVDSQLTFSPAKQPVPNVGSLMVFPSSWLSLMLPSSCQVQRPFYFLTPNLVSVFQLTFSSVCVLLCCKTIKVSTAGSWANSSLTHPQSIKELFKKGSASLSHLFVGISVSALKVSTSFFLCCCPSLE